MPTRKLRRRRQTDRRHEYEYVLVDEEGREVEVVGDDNGGAPASVAKETRKNAPVRAGAREIPPPSWRRVGKRALIFAPLMFLTVYFLAGDELNTQEKVMQTIFLLAIFLPFSYALDAITYRTWKRRAEREAAGGPKRKR